jgi:membrane protease YdiL (CAAX protease family)
LSVSDPIPPIKPSPVEIEAPSGPPSASALPVSTPPFENPVWRPLDVLIIALFAIVTIILLGFAAFGIARLLPGFHNVKSVDLAQSALILVPAQTVAYLFVVAFMVQIVGIRNRGERAPWDGARYAGQRSPLSLLDGDFLTAIRWNMPRLNVALGALSGGVALALLSGQFTRVLEKWIPKTLPIDELFRDKNSAYLIALFGVLVAPFVEELFFRGFLYPVLAKHTGIPFSVVFTAAAFAVMHQGQLAHAWVPLSWLFIVGAILTVVRARTKSVATCVLIHIGYNATLFTVVFIVTQGFQHMERA